MPLPKMIIHYLINNLQTDYAAIGGSGAGSVGVGTGIPPPISDSGAVCMHPSQLQTAPSSCAHAAQLWSIAQALQGQVHPAVIVVSI